MISTFKLIYKDGINVQMRDLIIDDVFFLWYNVDINYFVGFL